MGFTCMNEIEIRGGTEAERGAAASLILAVETVDEESASREERASSLDLRFESVDGLPEDEVAAIAPQFPSLSFTLVYYSLDGEFYGYARSGAGGEAAAESEDFGEGTRDEIGRRHDGDGLAFVRAAYGLRRAD